MKFNYDNKKMYQNKIIKSLLAEFERKKNDIQYFNKNRSENMMIITWYKEDEKLLWKILYRIIKD